MIALSLIAVVYIGFVALVQADMKKLIAYSSIAHMGFVTLGFFVIFAATPASPVNDGARMALQGGMMQMLSHGLISGALFLCVGVLYDRMHSREISAYGGVINTMPKFAALMVLFGLANAGLPGTSGFVGEFFVILGTFQANPWLAFFAATTLITGAAYTLWMIKRVVFGEVANSHVAELTDVGAREFWMLMVLAVAVLIMGIWPAPIVDRMDASIGELLMHVGQPKL
jgi:NADH-quinone oxidoreductase subunit M